MWDKPNLPYQKLPKLPPAQDLETRAINRALVPAARNLAALDIAARHMPDPTMLINLIHLIEAQASNEIENIVTTNDELFRAAHNIISTSTPAVKEALRYRRALRCGYEAIRERPVTQRIARTVCSEIHGHDVNYRSYKGTYIGNSKDSSRIYTPPEGEEVIRGHLDAWDQFVNDPDSTLDPLIIMALAHYQFEAIHPFPDGNGRTGRILNLLILNQHRLLQTPVLYLSGHLVRHKQDYYRLLAAVTEHEEWEPWIIFMLEAVESTSRWTLKLIERTEALAVKMEDQIRDLPGRLPAAELTRLFMRQPYVRISTAMEITTVSRPTATKWLNSLESAEIVTTEKAGRSTIFINDRLLEMLFSTELAD